ncbi:hypothetical protein Syun_003474 [Stephania yunnanensis]|uniref:Pentatricopeptide repeat-containing protein n=1 Tax=Stephania yunnanensis TaxID=152371 RepID=A0AAP0L2V0_9MAGN
MCITIINHCSRRHFSNPYSFIQLSQFHTDLGLCISSLQACALHKNLSKGKQIHSWMLVNGLVLNSLFATTSLINLYSKCNRPHEALSVFNTAHDRNLFTWNALIAGFVSNGLSTKAFEFYRKMRYSECFIPDEFTFPCVIKACCDLSEVVEAGRIRAELFKLGLDSDPFIASSLINFYLKYGFMSDARRMFEEMPNWERDRDVVLWNAMINGYAQSGLVDMALEVFVRMVREEGLVPSKFTVTGILSVCAMISSVGNGRAIHGFAKKFGYESDVVVSNSLIDMYGKCTIVDDAVKVFQEIPERDIFSWNSIISVREQSADYNEVLRLFDK